MENVYQLKVSGLVCDKCVAGVKKTIENAGGKNVHLKLDTGIADFESSETIKNKAIDDINASGVYKAELINLN